MNEIIGLIILIIIFCPVWDIISVNKIFKDKEKKK